MICPEGYLTPKALEARFLKVLRNDRVAPGIFEASGCDFDRISSRDRQCVFEVSAKTILHRLIQQNCDDAQVYCPTLPYPLRVDAWLFQTETSPSFALPTTSAQANRDIEILNNRFKWLCVTDWTVKFDDGKAWGGSASKSQEACLAKIQGWSICFREDLFAADTGKLMTGIARQIAREAVRNKVEQRKRGPKEIVTPLAEAILDLNGGLVPNKEAKYIGLQLRDNGHTKFSETTLRSAISKAKKLEKQ